MKKPFRYPPDEITFRTSNGNRYLHYGRDVVDGKVIEHVKNLKTESRKTMTEQELIKFKQT
ncbi:MAG TPA: hypothetical protein VFM69_06485 [Pricia sp.]|nr:hypothetical protein [Pricia sp.]